MSWLKKILSPEGRKSIYAVVASVNGLAVVVVPVLVSLGWIEQNVATQVLEIGAGVLAIASSIMAFKFVPVVSE